MGVTNENFPDERNNPPVRPAFTIPLPRTKPTSRSPATRFRATGRVLQLHALSHPSCSFDHGNSRQSRRQQSIAAGRRSSLRSAAPLATLRRCRRESFELHAGASQPAGALFSDLLVHNMGSVWPTTSPKARRVRTNSARRPSGALASASSSSMTAARGRRMADCSTQFGNMRDRGRKRTR